MVSGSKVEEVRPLVDFYNGIHVNSDDPQPIQRSSIVRGGIYYIILEWNFCRTDSVGSLV